MGDEEKLRNRLEPYNNIAVIATLLAGFALTIFPSGVDDDLDDDDFPWGLTGHILYNVLMGISFSINLVLTVMITLQMYFTQQLVVRHSATIAMRYMDRSENYRRISIALFYAVSIPTFILAFTILLFAALHRVAAVITSVVTIGGLIAVLLSIHSFYNFYGQTLQGLSSFTTQRIEERVNISRSSSALHKSSPVDPTLATPDTPVRPLAMDGPVIRGRLIHFTHGAKTADS